MSSVAMKYEDWIRECVRRDGQDGKVNLPCNIMLGIADWIEAHRDVAPVRHEEGRWKTYKGEVAGRGYFYCTACHADVYDTSAYCPNCGARMDGENDEID